MTAIRYDNWISVIENRSDCDALNDNLDVLLVTAYANSTDIRS